MRIHTRGRVPLRATFQANGRAVDSVRGDVNAAEDDADDADDNAQDMTVLRPMSLERVLALGSTSVMLLLIAAR